MCIRDSLEQVLEINKQVFTVSVTSVPKKEEILLQEEDTLRNIPQRIDVYKRQTLVWNDGCKYDGHWKNDVRDGKGVFEYANGDKYVGDWKEDIQHGKGIYFFHTGDRYEGSYVQGTRTGEGIYYLVNGDKYVGNFKDGMQDGRGIFTWANGAVYDGEWKDNQRNGYGKYKWNVGDSYEGEWKDNKFNGQGVLKQTDGTKYKGGFVNGMEEGSGIQEDKNGNRYEGFFKQGKKDGPFVETDKNGKVIRKGNYKMCIRDRHFVTQNINVLHPFVFHKVSKTFALYAGHVKNIGIRNDFFCKIRMLYELDIMFTTVNFILFRHFQFIGGYEMESWIEMTHSH